MSNSLNLESVAKMIINEFNKQQVRCAIIGGFALHAAGFHRATQDIDFLVHVEDVGKVKQILSGFGYDILQETTDVLNFWGRMDSLGGLDFIIAHRKYALGMLARSKSYEVLMHHFMNVVIPEDIIGLKLQALTNDASRYHQDMQDIKWLIKTYKDRLDLGLLREYFELFNSSDILEKLLKAE